MKNKTSTQKKDDIVLLKNKIACLQKKITKLSQNKFQYKNLFENASFPIFILDPKKDIILEMNYQAEQFLGYTKEELLKMRHLPFVPFAKKLRDITNWGIRLINTATVRTKSGEEVEVEMTAGIVENFSGKNSALILYMKDVTEETRLREQLLQSEKLGLIGRLSAGIAHEIRNPLTAVKICLQDFESVLSNDTNYNKSLNLANDAIQQVEQIIESTLEFARPQKPNKQFVNLNDVLEKSISFIQKEISKKNIKLKLNFSKNIPQVFVDNLQIQQVFLNLFTNAIDASFSNGEIEIKISLGKNLIANFQNNKNEKEELKVEKVLEYISVEFNDNGKGILPEDIENIFDPFYTTKKKGTGLGLAICKQIMDLNNGSISVSSNSNFGTIFTCYFSLNSDGKK